jgi:tRNA (cmo5U34)-methyltransferase
MSTPATGAFDQYAAEYDAPPRRLIPPFDAFYGTAVAAPELSSAPPATVLDVGGGTGLLARRMADAHPGARLTLLDGSAAMLDRARAALSDRASHMAVRGVERTADGRPRVERPAGGRPRVGRPGGGSPT